MTDSEKTKILDTVQNSAAGSDPRLNRTGLAAQGMTEEFDKKMLERDARIKEAFDGDEDLVLKYNIATANMRLKSRESIRQYEQQQVLAGAKEESKTRLDGLSNNCVEWMTLEANRSRVKALADAKSINDEYEAKIKVIKDAAKERQDGLATEEDSAKINAARAERDALLAVATAEKMKSDASLDASFNTTVQDLFTVHRNDIMPLLVNKDNADAVARVEVAKRVKGMLTSLIDAGQVDFVRAKLSQFSDPELVKLQEVETDKDGNVVLDENKNPKLLFDKDGKPVWSQTRFAMERRGYLGMSEVRELKDYLGQYEARTASANAAQAKQDENAAITRIDIEMANVHALQYEPQLDMQKMMKARKNISLAFALGNKEVSNAALARIKEIDDIIGKHENKIYNIGERASTLTSPAEFKLDIEHDLNEASSGVMYSFFSNKGEFKHQWLDKYQSASMKIDAGVAQGKIKLDDEVPGLGIKWSDWKKKIDEKQDVENTEKILRVVSGADGLQFFDEKSTSALAKSSGRKKAYWSTPDGRAIYNFETGEIENGKSMVFKMRVGSTDVTFTGEEVNKEIIPIAKQFLKTYIPKAGSSQEEDLKRFLFGEGGVISLSIQRKKVRGLFGDSYKTVVGPMSANGADLLTQWRKVGGRDFQKFSTIYAGNQIASDSYIEAFYKAKKTITESKKEEK